jgi:hypothetical protein
MNEKRLGIGARLWLTGLVGAGRPLSGHGSKWLPARYATCSFRHR